MFKGMCHQCLRLKWVGQVYTGREKDILTVLYNWHSQQTFITYPRGRNGLW